MWTAGTTARYIVEESNHVTAALAQGETEIVAAPALLVFITVALVTTCSAPARTPPAPTPTPSQAPSATPSLAGTGGSCRLALPADIEAATDGEVSAVPGQSTPTLCAFAVRSAGQSDYHLVVRLEDSFEDLSAVKAVFAGGADVPGVGQHAYWADPVTTLWFEAGGRLFAVQLIGFADGHGDPLAVASAVARAIAPGL